MNGTGFFESLAARARGEAVPEVDVADRVLGILSARGRRVPAAERPLMLVAVVSLIAAVPAAVAALALYGLPSDPLAEVLTAISWVTQ
jgi:hypothetical protein